MSTRLSTIPTYETSASMTVACLNNNPIIQHILDLNYGALLIFNSFSRSGVNAEFKRRLAVDEVYTMDSK